MRYRVAYSAEFRQMIVELVRAGRRPAELAKEFEPNAATIYGWVKRANKDRDKRKDGLTSVDRKDGSRVPHEVQPPSTGGKISAKTTDRGVMAQDLLSKKWSESST